MINRQNGVVIIPRRSYKIKPNDFLKGYHATSLKNSRNIKNHGFDFGRCQLNWLGRGVYLYTTKRVASFWASDKIRECSVLEVKFSVNGNVLDLTKDKNIDLLYIFAIEFLDRIEEYSFEFEQDKEIEKLRYAMIELFKIENDIKIIKSYNPMQLTNASSTTANKLTSFKDERNIIYSSDFNTKRREEQICICSNECIECIK